MEPLVLFGACLVVWCGYLAALDAIRDMKAVQRQCRAGRKVVKKRVKAIATGIGDRLPSGLSIVKPLSHRI